MFNKKTGSILTVALILGVLGVAGVAMAAQGPSGMPCADPTLRQQMMDSNVKNGFMTQEQADQMQKNMDQMMTGGNQANPMMQNGPMNPMMPTGPRGNTPTPGK